ncbi:MAG: hypothetical protein HY763_10420 [Planctomycetes bacterium]|nr:hypothetical protein [Planctomycetota bacterium]
MAAATQQAFLWLVVLLAVVLAAVVCVSLMRRRLRSRNDAGHPEFTLDELRRFRDEGRLTTAEYDRLRERMAAKLGVGATDGVPQAKKS